MVDRGGHSDRGTVVTEEGAATAFFFRSTKGPSQARRNGVAHFSPSLWMVDGIAPIRGSRACRFGGHAASGVAGEKMRLLRDVMLAALIGKLPRRCRLIARIPQGCA